MSTRNRTQEALDLLSGHYEVTVSDKKRGLLCISFWLCKTLGKFPMPLEGLQISAKVGDKVVVLTPERLDTSGDRIGMRLKFDALPEDWIGEAEISFGRSYRSFPFKGIPDISASFRPESRPPVRERPAEEAVL